MEELPIGKIPNFIAGSNRALTPIKQRSVTPTAVSSGSLAVNFRSSSVTNKISVAHTILESQPTQKYISKRKQRKWENANMILLERFLHKMPLAEDESKGTTAISATSKCGFNAEVRERFLNYTNTQTSTAFNATKRAVRNDQWQMEEDIWISKVKKRLRPVILELIKKREDICDYLRNFELLLYMFLETRSLPPYEEIPVSFLELLSSPDKRLQVTEVSVLMLPLSDLPLHRLVTYAACQFYGLHSEITANPDSSCMIRIWFPSNEQSVTSCEASLLGYLLASTVPATHNNDLG